MVLRRRGFSQICVRIGLEGNSQGKRENKAGKKAVRGTRQKRAGKKGAQSKQNVW